MGKWGTLRIKFAFIFGLVLSAPAFAQERGIIWNGQGDPSTREKLSESLKTHSVVILGENHGLKIHQSQQLEIMEILRSQGKSVHVGLEFFSYIYQQEVDAYRFGQVPETEFLKKIEWGGTPFEFYRAQALFPRPAMGERTWALNAPRALTSLISKRGLGNLTPELRELLPPQFALGRESYRRRFLEAMGDHIKDPVLAQNYFEAQCTWDDTMAWRIQNFQEQHPNATLVVIVGEFHVQYGGGLPDRLRARGVKDILVISQLNTDGMDAVEIEKQIRPDAEYGPRADWIWGAPAVD